MSNVRQPYTEQTETKAEPNLYGSIQSFGQLNNENILVIERNYQTAQSEQTADFNSEATLQKPFTVEQTSKNNAESNQGKDSGKKDKYLVNALKTD